MRILLDAQLPRSLVRSLEALGCDVLHTLDLPAGNRSSDQMISAIADRDQRVVFSKARPNGSASGEPAGRHVGLVAGFSP
ncbi:MAG: DUF5615 family PIN-like protein [Cyanobium sp.]